MKLMLRFIGRHIGMFLTAIFFLSIETFADLLQPTFMSYIVDKGVKSEDISAIVKYGAVMLGIAAFGALGAVMRNIYASRTSQLIGKEMRLEIYQKVQKLSFENIDRLQTSSIITRITNDVTQIQNFINGSMRIMMKAPVLCIGAMVLIIVQTPQMFPLIMVIVVIAGLLIVGNMKIGYPRFTRMQQKLDKLNSVSREFLSAVRVVKAFRAEETEEEKFTQAANEFAQAGVSSLRVMAVFAPLVNLTVNFGIVVMLWLSGYQTTIEIGKLMASVNYMTQILSSLGLVAHILNSAVRAMASAERVQEILDEVPAQKNGKENFGESAVHKGGMVSFHDVTFAYSTASAPALKNVSFTVQPGMTVGIIGPTGSGKSTLVNLVPRFYDTVEGYVEIDGVDVRKVQLESLRRQIAVVPQKALLFSGSIRDNLLWGCKEADELEIRRAAKIACADEFISGFSKGYDTILGQGGVNISGGQKQRISIARELLRKPRILILDDCTSALDATTEARVLEAIRREARDMTVLLVSQRISTVMRSDLILCMENGTLQGYGTHGQLLDNCCTYRAIYESQIGKEAAAHDK